MKSSFARRIHQVDRHHSRKRGTCQCGRKLLVDAIAVFLAHHHASGISEIRMRLERVIDEAGPGRTKEIG